jgi:hypothetical protein
MDAPDRNPAWIVKVAMKAKKPKRSDEILFGREAATKTMDEKSASEQQLRTLRHFKIDTTYCQHSYSICQQIVDEINSNGGFKPDDVWLAQVIVGEVPNDDFDDINDHGDQ